MISVLIVDDEKLVRDTLRRYIKWDELGVGRVFEAENGVRALAVMEAHAPSIVISDIKMPRMNGMDFAALLRERFPNSRLVFLSGYSDKEYLKGAIQLHADAYIEKPLNLREVSDLVRELAVAYQKTLPQAFPEAYFYRGHASGGELNRQVFTYSKAALDELGRELKNRNPSEGIRLLRRLCGEIRLCEGTPPDYVRNVYSKLAAQVESAADFHGANRAKKRCEQFVFSVTGCQRLSELEEELLAIGDLLCEEALSQGHDPVVKVNEYLRVHYPESSLSVEEVARSLNFNTSYLCALYKRKTGRTINAMLTRMRIERACRLLCETDKKLYEVGASVGYPNGKYFTKVFTKEMGVSPREYRERHL